MSDPPSEDRLESHRNHVRSVVSTSAPAWEAREGHRAPGTKEEEADLRDWYRVLFDEGLTGRVGRSSGVADRTIIRFWMWSRSRS
jgi:hypothetical protein